MEDDTTPPESMGDIVSLSLDRYRRTNLPFHQRVIAVQTAMAEIISLQSLSPSPTAYYAVLLTALNPNPNPNSNPKASLSPTDLSQKQAMVFLLSLVIPHVSKGVLRAKTSPGLAAVTGFLEQQQGSGSKEGGGGDEEGGGVQGTKAGVLCLQMLLQAADKTNWLSLANFFGVLLLHARDSRPKVRKLAQSSLVEVFADLKGEKAHSLASDAVVSVCEQLLTAAVAAQKTTDSQQPQSKKNKKGNKSDPSSSSSIASSSDLSQSSGTKAAVAALYMLGTLKLILPLLSTSAINRIMIRLAELTQLHQPLLTRHVFDTFQALFRSTAQVSELALSDVLGKILEEGARPVTKDSDEIRAMAQVVQAGLEKLHDLDQKVCAQRLPFAFHTLIDFLASEQEGVVYGAADSLRAIISTCIDDTLIQDALSQKGKVAELKGKSGPSSLERICSAMETTLSYQYSTAWDMALLLIASLFDKLGPASFLFFPNVVRTLGQLQDLPDSEMRCRKQLHAAVGSAIAAMGPEQFLQLLPLQMDGPDLATWRIWLLPILRQHIVGTSLLFFSRQILPLTVRLRERAKKAKEDDRPVAAKNIEACLNAVWALFPSICNYPSDTSTSFVHLAKTLGDTLVQEAEIRPMVCKGLQTLINQNRAVRGDPPLRGKKKGEEEGEEDEISAVEGSGLERARSKYNVDLATSNIKAMSTFSQNFLPILFNAFVAERPEKRSELQNTIASFASISDKATVKKFFVAVMQKLLQATEEQANGGQKGKGEKGGESMEVETKAVETATSRRCTFMDLAISMAPGLDQDSRNMLYITGKPGLQDSDSGVQKKAYKLLSRLCEQARDGFVERNSEDLLQNLLSGLPVCHSSAKRHRLLCLQYIIMNLLQKGDSQKDEAVGALLSEIILATKEANTKTRTVAYDLLVSIPRGMEASEGNSREGVLRFFNMVIAGLAGTTPHMISATIVALARLLYEYSTDLIHTVPELFPSVLLLLQSKSREIVKSCLGMVKVIIVRLPGDELEQHVRKLLEGLLLWCNDSKNHFKMKVRVILERLVRRCGYDVVARAIPEEHTRLLIHIRKTQEREQRKKRGGTSEAGDGKSVAGKSKAGTARKSQWDPTDIFEDDESGGSEEDYASTREQSEVGRKSQRSKNISAASARSMRNRKLSTRLPEDVHDGGEEPLDLLDSERTRSVLSAPISKNKRKTDDETEDIEMAEDGRLVIEEDGKWNRKRKMDEEEDEEGGGGGRGGGGDGKSERSMRGKKRVKGGPQQEKGRGNSIGRKGISLSKGKQSKGWAYTGEEYKAKAGGDVKKSGKLEPHAFWPLDPKMLNRRETKRAVARKGMVSVLRAGKKGGGGGGEKGALKPKGGIKKGQKSHKGQGQGKGKGSRR